MTVEEALEVMADPSNPKHEAYLRKDISIMREIERAYQERYGTQQIDIEQLNSQVRAKE